MNNLKIIVLIVEERCPKIPHTGAMGCGEHDGE